MIKYFLFDGKFAHFDYLSIRSFDCMVLRSFHTPSRYDFRSNVLRPHNESNKSNKIKFYLSYYEITITLNTLFWRSIITMLAFKKA